MIVSFRHKGLETFYRAGSTKGTQPAHARKLGMILAMLDVAKEPQDLNQPGLRLDPLKGHWSVRVNGNWRITFRSDGAGVELVDYQD
ncbi:Killer protein [Brucella pseudintermedia]|nr:Killer protein [Brucella pseudintermedia]